MSRSLRALLIGRAVLTSGKEAAAQEENGPLDFFEKKIRPSLATNCYNCHSAFNNSMGRLRVDDRNGLLTGGGRGLDDFLPSAVRFGRVPVSPLIRHTAHPVMQNLMCLNSKPQLKTLTVKP